MRRSMIIASCLVHSEMLRSIEEAEQSVRFVFEREFPNEDFRAWDVDVGEKTAEHIIRTVGRASRIDAAAFINDLRTVR